MTRRKVYSDPAFAEEMAAIQRDRDEARTAELAAFRSDYAAKLAEPQPAIHVSTLHRHEASCWGEVYETVVHGTRLRVQRCQRSNTVREAP